MRRLALRALLRAIGLWLIVVGTCVLMAPVRW